MVFCKERKSGNHAALVVHPGYRRQHAWKEHLGLSCSVQGVQEAAAAESSPARSQGGLTPAVVLLPFLFHHVHWGQSRARGERDSVRGIPAAASHTGSTEHTLRGEVLAVSLPLPMVGSTRAGATPTWLTAPPPTPVSGAGFLEGVNEGDICSAAVRPVSCYLPFSKLSMKTQVCTLIAPPVNQFAVSPALQPDGAQAGSFIHYLI